MTAKPKRLSGQELEGEQRIDNVDLAGRGVIHVREHQVLVPGAYRGETVRVQLAHRGKHGVHHAHLIELIKPAPGRVESPCPHFLDCGGCDLLHIHPEEQLRLKREFVASALSMEIDQVDAVGHGQFHLDYRAYAKFVVDEQGKLGSYRRRTHTVAPMDECVVHAPAIAAAHELVQTRLAGDAPGGIRYVVMRASISDERVIVTLVCSKLRSGLYRMFAHDIGKAPFVAAVDFHHNDTTGNAIFSAGPVERLYDDGKELCETIGALRLQLKSTAFSQINPDAAAELYAHVCAELEAHVANDPQLLDLYAGSGGIGLSYALKNPRADIVAVEANGGANEAARSTAATHELTDRHVAVTSNVLSYLREQQAIPARVVANPPRKGLGAEVIRELLRLAPAYILYVSCNPKTLAKDADALRAGGYEAVRVAPFDMFPNTAQVETVVTFRLTDQGVD